MSMRKEAPRSALEASTIGGGVSAPPAEVLRVPGLTVLWHPDPARVGARVALPQLLSGQAVALSRQAPAFDRPGGGDLRPLQDLFLSRTPWWLEPGDGGEAVVLSRRGSPAELECDGRRVEERWSLEAAALERGAILLLGGRVALLLHRLLAVPDRRGEPCGLVGESDALAELRLQIGRVAPLSLPVLLRGETGSGKELVARAIHEAGPRRDRPFVAVNMGAVPPTLAAAELFGAVRGAFTGADRRRLGFFRRAHGGTLFLDEIGETPAEVQSLLLRALEQAEIQPLGAEQSEPVDVRVVAATDSDLETALAQGRFRAPLLHRLDGYTVRVPPLRERRDDVGRLLVHFLRQELGATGHEARLLDPGPTGRPWLGAPLVARLAALDWPGNVRQLRNVARQLAVACRDARVAAVSADLERQLGDAAGTGRDGLVLPAGAGSAAPPAARNRRRGGYRRPAEVGAAELEAALTAHGWRIAATAAQLGISRTALYALIERCPGLRKASELGREEIEGALARRGGDLERAVEELKVSPRGLKLRMTALGIG
jgi:two-component system nitrogen regulation response regulator GlnG